MSRRQKRSLIWIPLALAAAALFWGVSRRSAAQPDNADARKYFYEDVQRPFFAPDPADPAFLVNQRPGSSDARFSRAKDPAAFRVFIVGGSIAQRYGGAETSSLAAALRLALPAKKIEVLNCGMRGYESFRELALIRELLNYSPDAVVLLSAQNEGMGSPPIALWRLRLMDRLKSWGLDLGATARLAMGKPVDPSATQNKINAVFRRNLGLMSDETGARGVRLVVVLPPINYRGNPPPGPFLPYVSEFAPGWLKYLRGDAAGALADWKASSRGPMTLFYMGRAAEKAGRWAEARDFYAQAYDDPAEWRAGPRRLAMMKEEAQARQALVVDADAAFRAKAFPKTPGLDVFDDNVHWFESRNDVVTAALLPRLRADTEFARLPWDDAALKRIAALVAAGKPIPGQKILESQEDESLATLRQAFSSMPGMTEGSSAQSVVFLDALVSRYPAWFRDLQALADRAEHGDTRKVWGQAALQADRPRLDMHFAQIMLERGRFAEAAAAARRALAQDPSLIAAKETEAVARALQGDIKGASENLRQLTVDFHRPHEADALRAALGL